MPYVCVSKIERRSTARQGVRGARVLVLGVAYKTDIDDMRESPALKLIELLRAEGADVAFHDPHVPELPAARPELGRARRRRAARRRLRRDRHGALSVDYGRVVERAPLVRRLPQRTRGVAGHRNGHVCKL